MRRLLLLPVWGEWTTTLKMITTDTCNSCYHGATMYLTVAVVFTGLLFALQSQGPISQGLTLLFAAIITALAIFNGLKVRPFRTWRRK